MTNHNKPINFMDPAIQQCPFSAYKELRDEAPVYVDPETGFYVVTRFEDIRNILKDPDTFGSTPMMESAAFNAHAKRRMRAREIFAEKGWAPAMPLPFRDEPEHRQMRAVLEKAFRPGRVKELDGFIKDTAYGLLEDFLNEGKCDWVKQFAVPLPLIIICHQMGAPKEDIWKIKEWTDAFFHRIGLMLPEDEELAIIDKEIEGQYYFQPIFEELRKNPNDSFLSDLVNTEIEAWGRPFNDNELHAEMTTDTFVGGSETTTNALGAGVKLLAENPDVWAQLKSDPDKYIKTFIEEVLRLESPVQGQYRFVKTDTIIDNIKLSKGSTIIIRFGSANRDERQFEHPEKLDLERPRAAAHMAFGMGNHHCLGATLARSELYWGFKALTDKISELKFSSDRTSFEYHPHYVFRALKSLNIDFTRETP